jgi:hypothetical protein
MSSKKRKSISLDVKYKVIQLIDKKTPYKEILAQFSDQLKDESNISRIKKNREKVIKEFETEKSRNTKRFRNSSYPEIDNALIEFIGKCNSYGLPTNINILKEKASEYGQRFGYNNFKASTGYINRFRERNCINYEKSHGEANSVPDSVCNDWLSKLPEIVKDYEPKNIFNGDEFGLFWRLLPSKTYALSGQKFKRGKKSKERISVFVCANMDGSEKEKLIAIGKSREPRCFRNKKGLPVIYRSNEKSWMKTDIFTEFLTKFNRKMLRQNRKVMLFIDNCSSHPYMSLSNVKIIFLPRNTTSRLQPMDQGIIKCLKDYYRSLIVRKLISILDNNQYPDIKSIDLFDALIMLKSSWNKVSDTTIKNCFIKAGFKFTENINNESEENANENDILWDELTERLSIQGADFNEYLNVDESVATSEEVSDPEIRQNFNTNVLEEDTEVDESGNESNISIAEEIEPPVRLYDALNAISILRKYVIQMENLQNGLNVLDTFENMIYNNRLNNLKQSKITSYLQK